LFKENTVMGLQNLVPRMPRAGKISLGVKKQTQKGVSYPSTVEYFVLNHLEDETRKKIEAIYGPEPKELDIVFPDDDLDKIIPTWLKWFSGGTKDDKGEMRGGKLRCYGDGPGPNGEPGQAVYLEKKDPITGISPMRPCMGPRCPDWKALNGRPQCAQVMQVVCLLPFVGIKDGVFVITTRSWYSIQSFHDVITWAMKFNGGSVKGVPFKIFREEETITFMDPNGQQKTSVQHIMKLARNEDLYNRLPQETAKQLDVVLREKILLPSADEMVALAASTTSDEENTVDVDAPKMMTAQDVIVMPEIVGLFEVLENISNKKFSEKARLLAIRKLEGAADLREAAIVKLNQQIDVARQMFPAHELTTPVPEQGYVDVNDPRVAGVMLDSTTSTVIVESASFEAPSLM
jgi:hypothetical protein